MFKTFLKSLLTNDKEINNKLSLEECITPWKNYREELSSQKLDLEKQIDKTVFTISSGAIALSLAILDKIAPSSNYYYLYTILGLGWASLVFSLVLQTYSFINTAKRLKLSIEKVDEIINANSDVELHDKEDEYYKHWTKQNTKIDEDNKSSFKFMLWGISLILLFAFSGLLTKENKQNQQININLTDSLILNIMSKEKKSQDTPKKEQPKTSSSTGSAKVRSSQMDTNKQAQQIKTPPIKTKPKE